MPKLPASPSTFLQAQAGMRRAFGDAVLPSVCKQGEAEADLEKHLPQKPQAPGHRCTGQPCAGTSTSMHPKWFGWAPRLLQASSTILMLRGTRWCFPAPCQALAHVGLGAAGGTVGQRGDGSEAGKRAREIHTHPQPPLPRGPRHGNLHKLQ